MVVGRTPSANRSRGAAMVAGLPPAVLRRSQMDGRRGASHLAVHAQQSAARLARTRLRAAACLRTHRRDRSDDRCADRASPMGPEANDDRRLPGDWDVSDDPKLSRYDTEPGRWGGISVEGPHAAWRVDLDCWRGL